MNEQEALEHDLKKQHPVQQTGGMAIVNDRDFGATVVDHSPEQSAALMVVEEQRAIQEVQASMIIAKKYPRDESASYARVMQACERLRLAEKALYSYPKGGQQIIGPSVHLAKVIARSWGNMNVAITELTQEDGESTVLTYCWDLETNYKEAKTFTVVHERHTKTGVKTLTDPRDIYEMVANLGSRRLRACILGVVPPDVVDAAVEKCRQTMAKGGGDKPLADRVRDMVAYFKTLGIPQDLLEKRLGHKMAAVDETELVNLRMIATGLKDGLAKREDYFDLGGPEGGHASSLNDEFKNSKKEKDVDTKDAKTETKK